MAKRNNANAGVSKERWWVHIIPAIVASALLAISAITFVSFQALQSTRLEKEKTVIDASVIEKHTNILESTDKRISQIEARISDIYKLPIDVKVASELEAVRSDLNQLTEEFNVLKRIIQRSPEDALAVTLLNFKQETLTKEMYRDLDEIKSIMKWRYYTEIGVLAGIFSTIFALIVQVILSRKVKE